MSDAALIQQIERLMEEVAYEVQEPQATTMHHYLMQMWELAVELYKRNTQPNEE